MAGRTAPASLADLIRGWDDADLRSLLEQRSDLVTPVPADTTQLVSRASTRSSLARALDRLDRFHLAVVEGLAALTEPATAAALATLLQASPDRVEQSLRRLHGLALVWPAGRAWRLVRAVHDVLGPNPAGLGPWSRESLPDDLDKLIEDSGADSRHLLRRLTWGPPSGRVTDLRSDVDVTTASSPVERLLARGLLVAVGPGTVVLPRQVGLHLRDGHLYPAPLHDPPVIATDERPAALVDRTAAAAAFDLVRRVEVLLEHWSIDPPAVLRGGGVGVREMRTAAQMLGVDQATAALHAELANEAGLLAPGDAGEDDLVGSAWLPTDDFDAWLGRPPAARWAALATAWFRTHRTHGLIGQRDDRNRVVNALAPDLERSLTPQIRELTLRLVAAVDGAPSEPDVIARMAWERPRAGGLRDALTTWTLRESAVLGITGLGTLSAHGRAILDSEEAERTLAPLLPEPVDHLLLQADLTAVAPGPLDSDLSADVALCAEVESRGGATVYRFTEQSVRRALDAGWSAARLHAFLMARSRTPVPQPLTYLVDDVARRHGQLRIGTVETYLRCDDAATLSQILTDPRAASLRLRWIAETVLVTDLPADLVLDRLRELGQAPVAEAADGSVRHAQRRRRRTRPDRPRTARAHQVVAPSGVDLDRAVTALRAGDLAAAAKPDRPVGSPAVDVARVLADLRSAADAGGSVWLRYVDQHGGLSERVVDPIRIDGGWLTAHDHRADGTRTFAVHRISAVSPV